MTNHSLCEKTSKGLVQIEISTRTQRAHIKTRVEEVEDGMFDAADVLIDRHPVIDRLALECDRRPRRTKTQEIPGRFEEGVQGVGLAAGGSATTWAIDMFPGRVVIERISREREIDILGQRDR